MTVTNAVKNRLNNIDRADSGMPANKRSSSGANALCWLRRRGYFKQAGSRVAG